VADVASSCPPFASRFCAADHVVAIDHARRVIETRDRSQSRRHPHARSTVRVTRISPSDDAI
jgi:hypothetical protein